MLYKLPSNSGASNAAMPSMSPRIKSVRKKKGTKNLKIDSAKKPTPKGSWDLGQSPLARNHPQRYILESFPKGIKILALSFTIEMSAVMKHKLHPDIFSAKIGTSVRAAAVAVDNC